MGNNNFGFNDLPKYLIIDTGEDELLYRPTIFKWENDGNTNAYFAMYARYYPASGNINPSQVLFCVFAPTYDKAKKLFLEEYGKNIKYINGRYWVGERPRIIDLMNMRVDRFLMIRNVKNVKTVSK